MPLTKWGTGIGSLRAYEKGWEALQNYVFESIGLTASIFGLRLMRDVSATLLIQVGKKG